MCERAREERDENQINLLICGTVDLHKVSRHLAKGSEYMYYHRITKAPGPTVPLSSGMIFD